MGKYRDSEIERYAERTGLRKPTPDEHNWIASARSAAVDLITLLALEESGIRDGDGYWGGSDAIDGALARFAELRDARTNRAKTEN